MAGGNSPFFLHPKSGLDSRPVAEMVVRQEKTVAINKYVLIVDKKKTADAIAAEAKTYLAVLEKVLAQATTGKAG